jgi:hypothetical protein
MDSFMSAQIVATIKEQKRKPKKKKEMIALNN